MPFRPKFDQIYRGPWDIEPHCGVEPHRRPQRQPIGTSPSSSKL